MLRFSLLAAALVACLLGVAPRASAGTYTVNVCGVGKRQWGNTLLRSLATAPSISNDVRCVNGDSYVGVTQKAGTTSTDATEASVGFTTPAGTTIADFTVRHRLMVKNSDTPGHNPYGIGVLGSTVFEGVGNYDDAVRKRLGALWTGGTSNAGNSNYVTRTGTKLASLAGYKGDATSLSFRLGCFKRGTNCDLDASGFAGVQISGLSVVLNDATPPTLTPAATGLLAGGAQQGSAPVSVTADDSAGIRDLALVDVTNPAAPALVGAESYDPGVAGATATKLGATCTYNGVHACPRLDAESVTPTALMSGKRSLVVRVTDAAGNVTDAGPYRVDVATPSDRGALNGAGATATAKLTAGFTTGRRGSRTVDAGQRPTVRGRLVNSSGAAIAGARLVVYTRATNASDYRRQAELRTGADGRYAFKATSPRSRYLRVTWTTNVNDTRPVAAATVKLRVRGRATLKAPRSVRVGQAFSLTGKLRGDGPIAGVQVIGEGYSGGRWRTFDDGRTRKGGRFRLRYAFESAASRGRTFKLRVRLTGTSGWPYTSGRTRAVRVRVR